jgi:nucleoside phosphorylase
VARVARTFGLEVMLVKEISDGAGEAAGTSWSDNLDECAERLGAWLRAVLAVS